MNSNFYIMQEKLFNQSKSKLIIAHDLFGQGHKRNLRNFRFRVSVYGVLIEKTQVLFKRHPAIDKYDLPGGGIEMGESIPEGLIREFKEETGLIVKPEKLLLVKDDFFTFEGEDAHGILIFYTVRKMGGRLRTNNTDSVEIKYFDLNTLNKDHIYRTCCDVVDLIRNNSDFRLQPK
jgi:ADP-ribose pyrophosphatase YjhB (NUDIX family)